MPLELDHSLYNGWAMVLSSNGSLVVKRIKFVDVSALLATSVALHGMYYCMARNDNNSSGRVLKLTFVDESSPVLLTP